MDAEIHAASELALRALGFRGEWELEFEFVLGGLALGQVVEAEVGGGGHARVLIGIGTLVDVMVTRCLTWSTELMMVTWPLETRSEAWECP